MKIRTIVGVLLVFALILGSAGMAIADDCCEKNCKCDECPECPGCECPGCPECPECYPNDYDYSYDWLGKH